MGYQVMENKCSYCGYEASTESDTKITPRKKCPKCKKDYILPGAEEILKED